MNNPTIMETGSPLQKIASTDADAFVVVVTATATTLNDLLIAAGGALPTCLDPGPSQQNRVPKHVYFQVPVSASNPVYMGWGNTTPVVGGPGLEFEVGVLQPFENAYAMLQINSFQFIATGETNLLVQFAD